MQNNFSSGYAECKTSGTNRCDTDCNWRMQRRRSMSKILIGVATAALWFALSHVANAEQVCRQVCDGGTCVSKCVDHPDSAVIVHEHDDYYRDHDRGPGVDVHVPGVGIDIGR
jgi:hypothetical protein